MKKSVEKQLCPWGVDKMLPLTYRVFKFYSGGYRPPKYGVTLENHFQKEAMDYRHFFGPPYTDDIRFRITLGLWTVRQACSLLCTGLTVSVLQSRETPLSPYSVALWTFVEN